MRAKTTCGRSERVRHIHSVGKNALSSNQWNQWEYPSFEEFTIYECSPPHTSACKGAAKWQRAVLVQQWKWVAYHTLRALFVYWIGVDDTAAPSPSHALIRNDVLTHLKLARTGIAFISSHPAAEQIQILLSLSLPTQQSLYLIDM